MLGKHSPTSLCARPARIVYKQLGVFCSHPKQALCIRGIQSARQAVRRQQGRAHVDFHACPSAAKLTTTKPTPKPSQSKKRPRRRAKVVEANTQRVADLSLRGAKAVIAPDEREAMLAEGEMLANRIRAADVALMYRARPADRPGFAHRSMAKSRSLSIIALTSPSK